MPHRLLNAAANPKGVAADVAASVSAATAGMTWVAQLNEILQLGATGVAIVAGLYAIRWHKVRIKEALKKKEGSDE